MIEQRIVRVIIVVPGTSPVTVEVNGTYRGARVTELEDRSTDDRKIIVVYQERGFKLDELFDIPMIISYETTKKEKDE